MASDHVHSVLLAPGRSAAQLLDVLCADGLVSRGFRRERRGVVDEGGRGVSGIAGGGDERGHDGLAAGDHKVLADRVCGASVYYARWRGEEGGRSHSMWESE